MLRAELISVAPVRASRAAACSSSASPMTVVRSVWARVKAASAASPSHSVPPGMLIRLASSVNLSSHTTAVRVQCSAPW